MIKQRNIFLAIVVLQLMLLAAGCRASGEYKKSDAPPRDFKILTYNVLYGFDRGASKTAGVDWIKSQAPDVVALQELNGFTQDSLRQTAALWGHPHSEILKEEGFPVGLTSRTEIQVIEKRLDPMYHGYLHCKTAGIHFFVIHLSPSSSQKRQSEADFLCQQVEPLLEQGEKVVLLGDFNAFSPHDRESLDGKKALLARMSRGKNLSDGRIDYSVLERLMNVGLTDVCHQLMPEAERLAGSFPSRMVGYVKSESDQEKYSRRIDFILMNPKLAKKCTKATISRGDIVDSISDHYPVTVTLAL